MQSTKLRATLQNGAPTRPRRWPAPSRSGTCSANRATRCAPPFPTWARCCWAACSTSTTPSRACSLVFKIADDNGLLLLDLKDLRAMLQHVGDNASQFTTSYGNISAASVGAIQRGLLADRAAGRRQVLRRADARHRRLHADGRRQGRGQHPRGRQADEFAAPVRHLPAVAAVGAVRAAARDRRSGPAQAGLLLRRGAPAVQRGAQGAGRAHRAGGAAGALQGRGRLLRDAEPARHSRFGAGPARQPGPACAARLHAARPEGRQGDRHDDAAEARDSTSRRPSPNWPSARRW